MENVFLAGSEYPQRLPDRNNLGRFKDQILYQYNHRLASQEE